MPLKRILPLNNGKECGTKIMLIDFATIMLINLEQNGN
jgi:hypothetical protein